MDKKDESLAKYQIAIQLMHQESNVMWSVFGHFVLSNTIIVAFLVNNPNVNLQKIASFLGVLICLAWYLSFERRWNWYVFRVIQARNVEDTLKGWNFLSDGKKFSSGDRVFCLKQSFLANKFKTELITKSLIFSFGLFYCYLLRGIL